MSTTSNNESYDDRDEYESANDGISENSSSNTITDTYTSGSSCTDETETETETQNITTQFMKAPSSFTSINISDKVYNRQALLEYRTMTSLQDTPANQNAGTDITKLFHLISRPDNTTENIDRSRYSYKYSNRPPPGFSEASYTSNNNYPSRNQYPTPHYGPPPPPPYPLTDQRPNTPTHGYNISQFPTRTAFMRSCTVDVDTHAYSDPLTPNNNWDTYPATPSERHSNHIKPFSGRFGSRTPKWMKMRPPPGFEEYERFDVREDSGVRSAKSPTHVLSAAEVQAHLAHVLERAKQQKSRRLDPSAPAFLPTPKGKDISDELMSKRMSTAGNKLDLSVRVRNLQMNLVQLVKEAGPEGVRMSEIGSKYTEKFDEPLRLLENGFSSLKALVDTVQPSLILKTEGANNVNNNNNDANSDANNNIYNNNNNNNIHINDGQKDDDNNKVFDDVEKTSTPSSPSPSATSPISPAITSSPKTSIIKTNYDNMILIYSKPLIPPDKRCFQNILIALIGECCDATDKDTGVAIDSEGISLSKLPSEWKRRYDGVIDLCLWKTHCGVKQLQPLLESLPEIEVITTAKDVKVRVVPGTRIPKVAIRKNEEEITSNHTNIPLNTSSIPISPSKNIRHSSSIPIIPSHTMSNRNKQNVMLPPPPTHPPVYKTSKTVMCTTNNSNNFPPPPPSIPRKNNSISSLLQHHQHLPPPPPPDTPPDNRMFTNSQQSCLWENASTPTTPWSNTPSNAFSTIPSPSVSLSHPISHSQPQPQTPTQTQTQAHLHTHTNTQPQPLSQQYHQLHQLHPYTHTHTHTPTHPHTLSLSQTHINTPPHDHTSLSASPNTNTNTNTTTSSTVWALFDAAHKLNNTTHSQNNINHSLNHTLSQSHSQLHIEDRNVDMSCKNAVTPISGHEPIDLFKLMRTSHQNNTTMNKLNNMFGPINRNNNNSNINNNNNNNYAPRMMYLGSSEGNKLPIQLPLFRNNDRNVGMDMSRILLTRHELKKKVYFLVKSGCDKQAICWGKGADLVQLEEESKDKDKDKHIFDNTNVLNSENSNTNLNIDGKEDNNNNNSNNNNVNGTLIEQEKKKQKHSKTEHNRKIEDTEFADTDDNKLSESEGTNLNTKVYTQLLYHQKYMPTTEERAVPLDRGERKRRKKREKKEKKKRVRNKLKQLEKDQQIPDNTRSRTSDIIPSPTPVSVAVSAVENQSHTPTSKSQIETRLSHKYSQKDLKAKRQKYRNSAVGILVSSIRVEWARKYGSAYNLLQHMTHYGIKKLKSLLQEVPNLILTGSGGFMRVTTIEHAKNFCVPYPPLGMAPEGKIACPPIFTPHSPTFAEEISMSQKNEMDSTSPANVNRHNNYNINSNQIQNSNTLPWDRGDRERGENVNMGINMNMTGRDKKERDKINTGDRIMTVKNIGGMDEKDDNEFDRSGNINVDEVQRVGIDTYNKGSISGSNNIESRNNRSELEELVYSLVMKVCQEQHAKMLLAKAQGIEITTLSDNTSDSTSPIVLDNKDENDTMASQIVTLEELDFSPMNPADRLAAANDAAECLRHGVRGIRVENFKKEWYKMYNIPLTSLLVSTNYRGKLGSLLENTNGLRINTTNANSPLHYNIIVGFPTGSHNFIPTYLRAASAATIDNSNNDNNNINNNSNNNNMIPLSSGMPAALRKLLYGDRRSMLARTSEKYNMSMSGNISPAHATSKTPQMVEYSTMGRHTQTPMWKTKLKPEQLFNFQNSGKLSNMDLPDFVRSETQATEGYHLPISPSGLSIQRNSSFLSGSPELGRLMMQNNSNYIRSRGQTYTLRDNTTPVATPFGWPYHSGNTIRNDDNDNRRQMFQTNQIGELSPLRR